MPRQMKDSEVEWIGEIPVNWELKRLKSQLIERKEKNDPVKTDFILSLGASYGVIPYSEKEGGGNKAKEDLSDYRLAYPGDIVMNSMNIISGSVGMSEYYGCVSPVYYMFYPRTDNVCSRYFHFMFQTKAFQRSLLGLGNGILIKESANGNYNTVRMRIPVDKLNAQILPIPSYDEQVRIADYLDSKCAYIDSVIEKTKESIEEYKKLKQAIITEAVTKGVRGERPMKDSRNEWIGLIPQGWNCTLIKRILTDIKDGTHGTYARVEHGKPLLSAKNVFEDGVRFFNNDSEISELDYYEIVSNGFPAKDDVLMCCVGTVGRSTVYTLDEPMAFQRSVSFLRCNKLMNHYYLNYYLQSYAIQKEEQMLANGTAQVGLYMNDVKKLHIVVPSIEEQMEIVKYLDDKILILDSLISSKEQTLLELATYKKSLIYEYVTGKKEVPAS